MLGFHFKKYLLSFDSMFLQIKGTVTREMFATTYANPVMAYENQIYFIIKNTYNKVNTSNKVRFDFRCFLDSFEHLFN